MMPFAAQVINDDQVDTLFLNDVIQGLGKVQKTLPCKYFYDEQGSLLFEKICDTPEYYVTRSECYIYEKYASAIAGLIGKKALIVEPGAGSVKKIELLLEKLDDPAGFIPMDISEEMLHLSSDALAKRFPDLDISPVVTDFLDKEALKHIFSQLSTKPLVDKRVVFFPGSTIGNFHPHDAECFLKQFSQNLQPGDALLIGVDLVKDIAVLESAYNDTAGTTADFNLNLLQRINRELEGDFSLKHFDHQAVFNEGKSRIEMHLVSTEEQQVRIADQVVSFNKNETIHTENSYKYSVSMFRELAKKAGFSLQHNWYDDQQLFSVYYLTVD